MEFDPGNLSSRAPSSDFPGQVFYSSAGRTIAIAHINVSMKKQRRFPPTLGLLLPYGPILFGIRLLTNFYLPPFPQYSFGGQRPTEAAPTRSTIEPLLLGTRPASPRSRFDMLVSRNLNFARPSVLTGLYPPDPKTPVSFFRSR